MLVLSLAFNAILSVWLIRKHQQREVHSQDPLARALDSLLGERTRGGQPEPPGDGSYVDLFAITDAMGIAEDVLEDYLLRVMEAREIPPHWLDLSVGEKALYAQQMAALEAEVKALEKDSATVVTVDDGSEVLEVRLDTERLNALLDQFQQALTGQLGDWRAGSLRRFAKHKVTHHGGSSLFRIAFVEKSNGEIGLHWEGEGRRRFFGLSQVENRRQWASQFGHLLDFGSLE